MPNLLLHFYVSNKYKLKADKFVLLTIVFIF